MKDAEIQTSLFDHKQDIASINTRAKRKMIEIESDDQNNELEILEVNSKSKPNELKNSLIDEFTKPMKPPYNKQKVDDKNKNASSSKYLKLNDSIEVQSVRKAQEMGKNSAEISKEEVI